MTTRSWQTAYRMVKTAMQADEAWQHGSPSGFYGYLQDLQGAVNAALENHNNFEDADLNAEEAEAANAIRKQIATEKG